MTRLARAAVVLGALAMLGTGFGPPAAGTRWPAGGQAGVGLAAGPLSEPAAAWAPALATLWQATTVADVRAAWQAAVAEAAGSPAAGQGRHSDEPVIRTMSPIADLDGDGLTDVVVTRGAAERTRYDALSGRDGSRLWRLDVAVGGGGYVRRLRGPGPDGVLATTVSVSENSDTGEFSLTMVLTALDRDGSLRFQRRYDGTGDISMMGAFVRGLATPIGVGRIDGDGDDIAVRIDDMVSTERGFDRAHVEVVDGVTGEVTYSTDVLSGGAAPAISLVGDLSGDHRPDLVLGTQTGSGPTHATARTGTGELLWVQQVDVPVSWVVPAGHTDDDRVADIIYVGTRPQDGRINALLASGATGQPRWLHQAHGVVPEGDIDGDGRADVLLAHVDEGDEDDPRLSMRYAALTATGRLLYERRYGLKRPPGNSGASLSAGAIGDVDADGLGDVGHDMLVVDLDQGVRAREHGAVLARNGRKAYDGPVGTPLFAAVDGDGDDLAVAAKRGRLVWVTVRNGATGRRLWRVSVPAAPGPNWWPWIEAADLDGDGHAEVLASALSEMGSTNTVLDGRTGRVRWHR